MTDKKKAVALGNFDGLHIGHSAVIGCAVSAAERGFAPAVLLLEPMPSRFFGKAESKELLTAAEKEKLICGMGAQVIRADFSEIKDYSPEEFFEKIILGSLNAGMLCCGFNYRFGKNGSGDSTRLAALCEKSGVELHTVSAVHYDGQPVSSTRIRAAIESGEIVQANEMLGRPFGYCLEVVHGDEIGRKLDCPTLNQLFPEGMIVPKYGVYASKACVDGVWYRSVTNIGRRPTFENDQQRSETHILDFCGDLYGKQIEVHLLRYIRGEVKFTSTNELRAQLEKDKNDAKN